MDNNEPNSNPAQSETCETVLSGGGQLSISSDGDQGMETLDTDNMVLHSDNMILHTAIEEYNSQVATMLEMDIMEQDMVETAIANVLSETDYHLSQGISIEQPTTYHTETGDNAFFSCFDISDSN